MGLSIKNPKAEKLAREVAREAGESITEALIHALEERYSGCVAARPHPTPMRPSWRFPSAAVACVIATAVLRKRFSATTTPVHSVNGHRFLGAHRHTAR